MMEDWPALRKWNLDYFDQRFGDRVVEVQMGRNAGANYETEREKFVRKVRFGDFLAKVRTAGETNDFYLTANNNSANRGILPELWDDIVQIPEDLAPDPPPLDGPGWHDHTVSPRLDEQLYGTGHRPQANQAGTIMGPACDAQSLALLFASRRPRGVTCLSPGPR
jgi:hypothetical protein